MRGVEIPCLKAGSGPFYSEQKSTFPFDFGYIPGTKGQAPGRVDFHR